MRYSVFAPGVGWPSTVSRSLRLSRCQAPTRARHSIGISESTLMRARTSSPRLVSWVAVADRAWGERSRRSALAAWNSAMEAPKRLGSPPTSLSETRRLNR